jgi:hypothetical protein
MQVLCNGPEIAARPQSRSPAGARPAGSDGSPRLGGVAAVLGFRALVSHETLEALLVAVVLFPASTVTMRWDNVAIPHRETFVSCSKVGASSLWSDAGSRGRVQQNCVAQAARDRLRAGQSRHSFGKLRQGA